MFPATPGKYYYWCPLLSTSKRIMLVSMRLARKYAVPEELALLYEFLNSTDLRTYVEKGVQHVPSDELATLAQFENWMRERGLLKSGEAATVADHRKALQLRD